MKKISKKINIYCDGADFDSMKFFYQKNFIKGFTTNPSLMNSSGIKNYKEFSKKALQIIKNKSLSLEVFSDNLNEMERQANIISTWGKNIYVKIPITNTKGKSCLPVVKKLIEKKIKVNITAVFTQKQITSIKKYIRKDSDVIVSIFAGRIADAGVDPNKIILKSIKLFKNYKNVKTLWASTREIYNIIQAAELKCDIITVPINMLKKLDIIGKNLEKYSLETVKGFYIDAKKAKYKL
jgi:transaldolase